MNSPHTHPRATEINFSVNTTLRGGVLVENGARFAEVDIAPGSATVFPQGAIHFEMNPSCEPAMFVAGFNGEDPGVNQVAQRCKSLVLDILLFVWLMFYLQSSVFPRTSSVLLSVVSVFRKFRISRTSFPTTLSSVSTSASSAAALLVMASQLLSASPVCPQMHSPQA
jgi:hypothetical protein